MKFRPCNGGCTDKGTHCDGCGRTHEEVAEFNRLVGGLAAQVLEQGYENIDDYANSVAKSIFYKLENAG